MTNKTVYPWNFQRIGGIDQVVLKTAEDIAHLDELDPKLWMVLSCPASGLEFDDKTLALLDKNKDGRIRIPEVVDAVKWLRSRLVNLNSIIDCADELPFSAIDSSNKDGERLLITAKAILANINKTDKQTISLADLNQSTLLNANNLYNGDGIVPVSDKIDTDIQAFIKDALSVIGGVKDASGLDGINNDIAQAFKTSLQTWLEWRSSVGSASTLLGEDTAEAWELVQDLKAKIDDYFLRTELASYAPQAEPALNVNEKYIVPTDNGLLANETLSELPLSKIIADRPLILDAGLNPIWREKVSRLAQLAKPFLEQETQLTRLEWLKIQEILAPYAKAVLSKPSLAKVDITINPKMPIDKLGEKRANEILGSDLFERFAALAEKDSKTPAAAADVADVERLVIFNKNLYRLLMNFVSFADFFDFDRRAAFQSGRLFIDGRCCSLCVSVSEAVAQHTTLANYSELYLLYCECTRKTPPVTGNPEKRTIVAAMTAGDADFLLEGRNGVFVDNKGNDWDAKVVKIITKPISISQAIWDPYKRIGRFITEQINKWASSKDSALMDSATKTIQTPPAATNNNAFDIGKSVGIFAAIGLAIGAIGTALATLASSLFQLEWWQFPLVILGLFIIISGPSVIMAWLKLRQRTIGPLLEASGWAINGRLKINFFLGSQLTSEAELPKNATRSLFDPTKKRYYRGLCILFLAIIIGAGATGGWFWYQNKQAEQTTVQQPEPVKQAQSEPSSSTIDNETSK